MTGFPTLGEDNTNILDKLVALLLATAPLLQHYKGVPVFHAGFLVLIVCIPYVCIKLLLRIRKLEWKNLWFALPLVLFQVYRVAAHGTNFIEFMHAVVLSAYFIAIVLGGINLRYVTVSACTIALAASVAVAVQTILYYAFGTHLQLAAASLLLEESEQWVALVKTGIIGITGRASLFYRPSAFFLEPSHMLMYSMPVLFFLLLTPQMTSIKRLGAVILSLGLMLSTSGMGIGLVFGVWMLQLGFSSGKENHLRFKNLFRKQNILHCLGFLFVFCALCFALPSLRYAIMRVFFSDQQLAASMSSTQPSTNLGSSTAVSGRVRASINALMQMTTAELRSGIGDVLPAHFAFSKPGFFATIFRYGIPGMVISYLYYLFCAFYTKHAYRWIALITILLSFVDAQTHGTFYMLFYVLFLMEGCLYMESASIHGAK